MGPFQIYEAVAPGTQAAGSSGENTSYGFFLKKADADAALKKIELQNWGTAVSRWAIKGQDGKIYLLTHSAPITAR